MNGRNCYKQLIKENISSGINVCVFFLTRASAPAGRGRVAALAPRNRVGRTIVTTASRHLDFISCVCVQLDTQAHTHTRK